MATIIIGLVVMGIALAAGYSVYKDHKKGGCGGCNGCAGKAGCGR